MTGWVIAIGLLLAGGLVWFHKVSSKLDDEGVEPFNDYHASRKKRGADL